MTSEYKAEREQAEKEGRGKHIKRLYLKWSSYEKEGPGTRNMFLHKALITLWAATVNVPLTAMQLMVERYSTYQSLP